ncbi:ABC transporter substrate-binding protein [Hoeflea sp. WL0058]|uniref:ABC transporter substrate-binding protein n=1 Tax=Flavimaribacter sediminis TaxID=2865987 RepID=A0AAE2ZMG1_9HYPH|nr:ABC transporter substrate-binding protein [Flavimaribacter sediminis]MBW8638669.1 ABC transporter substrate-binding protein [Flavimaribacter sediminis]
MKILPVILSVASILGASVAAQAESILIGISNPYTGPAAIAAEREKWGIDLAVEEINEAGGLLGMQIELLPMDNKCNPSEAVNVANKLVEAKVNVIIGAHCSSATLATMPIIEKAGIPMVTAVSTSPAITDQSGVGGNKWEFRINPSDAAMMKTLAGYLANSGKFSKVAIIGEDTDFGRGGAGAFAEFAKEAGVEIISTDFAPQGLPDFTPVLTKVSRSKPDAIALFQLGSDQLTMLRNAMQLGLTIPYTGRAELGGQNEELISAGGMEGSVSAWTYSPEIDTPENKAFAEKIKVKHEISPVLQTWAGYDSVNIIAQAIKEAGSAEPAAIRDALEKIEFTTVMGKTISFDDYNQAGEIVVILGVNDNKVDILSLEQVAK